jgi:hypothetical protein
MSREVSDKFWLESPQILINKNRIIEFIPSEELSDVEKLNSVVRFSIISSVALSLYKKSFKPYFFILFTAILTAIVYYFSKNRKRMESLTEEEQKNCVKPTRNNPFMNVLLSDYIDNPERGPACKYYDESEPSINIKKQINDSFEYNLYSDFEDMFQRKNSGRQYYTMPSTTIPSDRDSFQNWLYQRGESCKEDNKACVQNIYSPVQGKPIFFEEIAKTA